MSVALVDYGAGNLTSVRKALGALGAEVTTPRGPEELATASAIIVPGVGHFGQTEALDERWRGAIRAAVDRNTPVLGICLGMQWLYQGSEEAPAAPGLGIFGGTCRLIEGAPSREARLKVPHVGWNSLDLVRSSPLVRGLPSSAQAYFTHSYAAPVTDDAVAVTSHGAAFASIVARGLVVGAQFHPEKSGEVGLAILRRFLDLRRTSSAEAGLRAGSPVRMPRARPPVLSKRIIACLDVRDGVVVKGVQFEGLTRAGDPAVLARRYNAEGIDEVVILDVTATLERRRALAETIRAVAGELFIPLTVGGGIRTEADAAAAIDAGADKVSLNTAALRDPALITTLAGRYGSQAVVVAIDAKRRGPAFEVYARSATVAASRDAVDWAVEASHRGAGEILLTSIDRDGTRAGFDCELTAAVSRAVPIPVIASGGAGTFEHFREVFSAGLADAALAASVFHFSEHAVSELKSYLASHGLPMRTS